MKTAASPFPVPASPIAVVGNLNLDYRTSPIPAVTSIMSDGETTMQEIYETLGGGGANTAAAATALGGRVHLVAAVGNDSLRRRLEAHLASIGIVPILARKDAPTGRSIALTWDHHERHFLSCLPSSALLAGEDIDLKGLHAAGCRALYRADVWFAPRLLESGNLRLLRDAEALGMETSLDVNWDPVWSTSDAGLIASRVAALAGALPHVNYVHGNERELCRFTGEPNPIRAAKWILDRGAGTVVLHRGAQGCAVFTNDGRRTEMPARPVDHALCESGTGDVFIAAFLLLPDLPMTERLRTCAEVAARHLEGSMTLLPRLS